MFNFGFWGLALSCRQAMPTFWHMLQLPSSESVRRKETVEWCTDVAVGIRVGVDNFDIQWEGVMWWKKEMDRVYNCLRSCSSWDVFSYFDDWCQQTSELPVSTSSGRHRNRLPILETEAWTMRCRLAQSQTGLNLRAVIMASQELHSHLYISTSEKMYHCPCSSSDIEGSPDSSM
jgi:hypothetical protein